MGVFVEEETRKQDELTFPANKPFLSPECSQPSGFALKGTWKRPSSAPLSFLPYTLVSLPAYSKDDGYITGRAGDVMGLLYS